MTISKGRWVIPFLVGAALSLAAPACGTVKLNIKTWYLDREQAQGVDPDGILIRKQGDVIKEWLKFEEARAYRCLYAKDFDYLIYLAKQNGIRGID